PNRCPEHIPRHGRYGVHCPPRLSWTHPYNVRKFAPRFAETATSSVAAGRSPGGYAPLDLTPLALFAESDCSSQKRSCLLQTPQATPQPFRTTLRFISRRH